MSRITPDEYERLSREEKRALRALCRMWGDICSHCATRKIWGQLTIIRLLLRIWHLKSRECFFFLGPPRRLLSNPHPFGASSSRHGSRRLAAPLLNGNSLAADAKRRWLYSGPALYHPSRWVNVTVMRRFFAPPTFLGLLVRDDLTDTKPPLS